MVMFSHHNTENEQSGPQFLTSIFLRENCIFSKFTDVYVGEPITNKKWCMWGFDDERALLFKLSITRNEIYCKPKSVEDKS